MNGQLQADGLGVLDTLVGGMGVDSSGKLTINSDLWRKVCWNKSKKKEEQGERGARRFGLKEEEREREDQVVVKPHKSPKSLCISPHLSLSCFSFILLLLGAKW